MRRIPPLLALLAAPLAAQVSSRGLFVRPAPVPPAAARPQPHGWWGGRGFIWPVPAPEAWGQTRPAAPAEKIAPLFLHNPDYQPERYTPAVRDYPAGSLPAPASLPVENRWIEGDGLLVETGGDSTPVRAWREENNSLVFLTADGRRGRISIDRLDRSRSRLPLQ